MAIASAARLGLVTIACAWSLGCGDGDNLPDAPTETAGGAGAAAGGAGADTGSGGVGTGDGGATLGPSGGVPTEPSSARHTPRPSGSVEGTTAGYWEYLPPHYGDGALYPLLLFGHGRGQNGNGTTDLPKVLKHGPPKLINADQWPADRPFIVLSMQESSAHCPTSQEVDDFLTFALGKYDVDPERVYLTGLSCGANGDWNYLGDHLTEKVAAAVLIAGDARGAFATAMCNLGSVPIWAFHGDADTTVPPADDGVPIASLNACDPAPVDLKYTVYPGVGHDSWTMTYDLSNPANDIYAWLLSHQKL